MFGKLFSHRPSHGTVVAYLALFLTLTGGTAFALSGSNTVFSDDIKDGEVKNPDIAGSAVGTGKVADESLLSGDLKNGEVKNPDIAADAVGSGKVVDNSLLGADINESSLNLAAGAWQSAPLRPTLAGVWKNFDANHNPAAFLRDRFGFVHLRGVVDADGAQVGTHSDDAHIFTLPAGYRPVKREVHPTLTNGALGRINVHGLAFGSMPAGAVSIESPTTFANAKVWISLDGISFRCAPSGSDGCP